MNRDIIEEFLQCRPVDEVSIRSEVQRLRDENQALKNAILTGSENKSRYSGQVTEYIFSEAVCACGETVIFDRVHKVPWTTISSVLKLVQKTSEI